MKYAFSLLFVIIGTIILLALGLAHESVHREIYKSYDIDSHLELHFPNLVTVYDEPCPKEGCILANNINEAIGYHLQVVYLLLFAGFLIIIVLLEERVCE